MSYSFRKSSVSKTSVQSERAKRAKRYQNTKGNYPYPWNNLLGDTTGVDMIHLSPESVKLSKLDDMKDKRVSIMLSLVQKYNDIKMSYTSASTSIRTKFTNTIIII